MDLKMQFAVKISFSNTAIKKQWQNQYLYNMGHLGVSHARLC